MQLLILIAREYNAFYDHLVRRCNDLKKELELKIKAAGNTLNNTDLAIRKNDVIFRDSFTDQFRKLPPIVQSRSVIKQEYYDIRLKKQKEFNRSEAASKSKKSTSPAKYVDVQNIPTDSVFSFKKPIKRDEIRSKSNEIKLPSAFRNSDSIGRLPIPYEYLRIIQNLNQEM